MSRRTRSSQEPGGSLNSLDFGPGRADQRAKRKGKPPHTTNRAREAAAASARSKESRKRPRPQNPSTKEGAGNKTTGSANPGISADVQEVGIEGNDLSSDNNVEGSYQGSPLSDGTGFPFDISTADALERLNSSQTGTPPAPATPVSYDAVKDAELSFYYSQVHRLSNDPVFAASKEGLKLSASILEGKSFVIKLATAESARTQQQRMLEAQRADTPQNAAIKAQIEVSKKAIEQQNKNRYELVQKQHLEQQKLVAEGQKQNLLRGNNKGSQVLQSLKILNSLERPGLPQQHPPQQPMASHLAPRFGDLANNNNFITQMATLSNPQQFPAQSMPSAPPAFASPSAFAAPALAQPGYAAPAFAPPGYGAALPTYTAPPGYASSLPVFAATPQQPPTAGGPQQFQNPQYAPALIDAPPGYSNNVPPTPQPEP